MPSSLGGMAAQSRQQKSLAVVKVFAMLSQLAQMHYLKYDLLFLKPPTHWI